MNYGLYSQGEISRGVGVRRLTAKRIETLFLSRVSENQDGGNIIKHCLLNGFAN